MALMHFIFDPAHWAFNRMHMRQKPMRALYFGDMIRNFAAGLFGIFEPLYLFLIFKGHSFSHPLSLVLLYYAAFSFLFGPLSVVATRLLPRFGFRTLTFFSFLALFLYFLILAVLDREPILVIAALAMSILHNILFWPAYHVLFTRSSDRDHRGEAYGKLMLLSGATSVVSPAIGGLLLASLGYPALFAAVLFLLFIAVVPYTFISIQKGYSGSFQLIGKEMRRSEGRQAAVAFFAQGVEEAIAQRIWPLFLFLLAFSYQSLGAITFVGGAIGLLTSYYVGRLTDLRGRTHIFRVGARLTSLAWIFRVATFSRGTAFLADSVLGFVRPFSLIPFMLLFYRRVGIGTPTAQIQAVVFRELTLHFGKGLLCLIAAGWAWLDVSLRPLLFIAVPTNLVMLWIVRWARLDERVTGASLERAVQQPALGLAVQHERATSPER